MIGSDFAYIHAFGRNCWFFEWFCIHLGAHLTMTRTWCTGFSTPPELSLFSRREPSIRVESRVSNFVLRAEKKRMMQYLTTSSLYRDTSYKLLRGAVEDGRETLVSFVYKRTSCPEEYGERSARGLTGSDPLASKESVIYSKTSIM